jgi:hypothetical protein
MNKKHILFGMAILLAAAVFAAAQDTQTDRIVVPLTNPGKPAHVVANIFFGAIKASGYDGKDIIVEAKPREKSLVVEGKGDRTARIITRGRDIAIPVIPVVEGLPARGQTIAIEEKEKEKKDKAAGMKRIPIESSGLTVEEDNNEVTIRLESMRRSYDLDIKVPLNSSLKLSGANLDEINVENVNGELEASCANGNIKLMNVSGTVVTTSTNGDIEVVLSKVASDKPMSFVTFNGDIDVTLPADVKASLKIRSQIGEVYSDFDVSLKSVPAKTEESAKKEGGRYRVSLDRSVYGTINGGGPEFRFQTNSGDIYIRMKK